MPEKELVERLKQKNEIAFKQLIESHQKMVINTCYGLLQNREDAEDIAQNVFIDFYNSIDKFRGEAKLKTWLYRISVNHSLNYIKSKNRRKWLSFLDQKQSITINTMHSHNSDAPEFRIEKEQRATILKTTIEQLPEKQKIAFTLSKYEELSYSEIAEVMNLSVSSIESLLFRAKKNLQKSLLKIYKKNDL